MHCSKQLVNAFNQSWILQKMSLLYLLSSAVQARAAELLQLHTELRKALFGRSPVLRKNILPAYIRLDLLKFLHLWDYEGGLAEQVRHERV